MLQSETKVQECGQYNIKLSDSFCKIKTFKVFKYKEHFVHPLITVTNFQPYFLATVLVYLQMNRLEIEKTKQNKTTNKQQILNQ